MIRAAIFASFVVVLWSAACHAADERTWTDTTAGRNIKAALVELEGETAVLRKADGKVVRVPLRRLSVADQDYVAALPRPAGQPPQAGEERQRMLAELEAARTRQQAAAAAKLKAQQLKVADLSKRLERIRKAKGANPKTLQRYEAEEQAAIEAVDAHQATASEIDKKYEQDRRRIMLTHKIAGDPPLVEQDGVILTEEEMTKARDEANRPKPTAEQVRQVQVLLDKARRLLGERELPAARTALAEAQRMVGEGELPEMIGPVDALANCVEQFWKAVDAGLPGLANSELQIGETMVFVIEARADHLLIRTAGRNVSFTRKTMPAGLARTIAEASLEKSATSKAVVGAFLVVDPKLAAAGGKDQARALWKEAAAGGVNVADLVKSLDAKVGR